ncbi:MAG: hypothetical protein JKP98_19280 [Rhodobacteraceae bacterium]|nr:hypothetical protein [Paracoccaceae bacterium]
MAFYHDLKRYDADKARWIAERLLALRTELRASDLGRRQAGTLVIGSWNIRAFDDGTPRRDESYHYIAEIIDKFDICAVQEVKADLDPLRRLVRLLGPNWDWFVTDVTEGDPGNTNARRSSTTPMWCGSAIWWASWCCQPTRWSRANRSPGHPISRRFRRAGSGSR